MKVYAIVCEYGAGAIYENVEMVCKTHKIAESYYLNEDFIGRPRYIQEMDVIMEKWSKPKKKKKLGSKYGK